MQPHLLDLFVAPFTPMNPDGSVNFPMIEEQADAFFRNGLAGVFICGTTGEGLSLTLEERIQVMEAWRKAAGRTLQVIVHVGHTSIAESKVLAEHSERLGARAIAALPPIFYKPTTVAGLVDYCHAIAEVVPRMPFYYYHIPSMSGVTLPMVEFMIAASDSIPSFAGLKYSHDNLMEFGRCLLLDQSKYDVLFGRDEYLLCAMALGAQGAIGIAYNYAAPLYKRLIRAFADGDLAVAQVEQFRAMQVIAIIQKFGGLPAAKAVMKMIDIDCGPPRLPLQELSEDQCQALREQLNEAGFFLSVCKDPDADRKKMKNA
jgi:N-acetylneuraminate lyase